MKQYLLGIDVGTTGTKTLLFSEDGECLARAYRGYALAAPKPGYSEQDAEDLWRAVIETVREVTADPAVASHIAALSLSLQGGTLIPVDGDLRPLCPAIVWNDTRCEEELSEYIAAHPRESMYEKTGWDLLPGLPALQIRHLRKTEPEIFEKTAYFLTVPDFIAARMTGIPAVDLSDAGINQLCDIRKGTYDAELLTFAGIPEEKLPKICPSGTVIGKIKADAAREMGINPDAVLVAGAHDQYAVALGAGATKAGDILIGSGTAWVVTALSDQPDFRSGLAQSVSAVPGLFGSLSSLSSGGVCLEWLRNNLSMGQSGEKLSYAEIDEKTASRRPAFDGLFFYPFSGKRSDSENFSRGTLTGLSLSSDRFDIAAAMMEGVAFQAVWMMESFAQKPSPEGLKLSGGASRSPVWRQILSDIAGIPVRIPEIADLACVGAAVMAGVGCGLFADYEEGCRRLAVRETVVQPRPEESRKYKEAYARYKERAAGIR